MVVCVSMTVCVWFRGGMCARGRLVVHVCMSVAGYVCMCVAASECGVVECQECPTTKALRGWPCGVPWPA